MMIYGARIHVVRQGTIAMATVLCDGEDALPLDDEPKS